MDGRICTVFKIVRKSRTDPNEKVDDGLATFRAFGIDYDYCDGFAVHYSTAIVERDDGTLESVPLHLIRMHK